MTDPLLETWQINARVVQMFAHIPDLYALSLESGKTAFGMGKWGMR